MKRFSLIETPIQYLVTMLILMLMMLQMLLTTRACFATRWQFLLLQSDVITYIITYFSSMVIVWMSWNTYPHTFAIVTILTFNYESLSWLCISCLFSKIIDHWALLCHWQCFIHLFGFGKPAAMNSCLWKKIRSSKSFTDRAFFLIFEFVILTIMITISIVQSCVEPKHDVHPLHPFPNPPLCPGHPLEAQAQLRRGHLSAGKEAFQGR